MIEQVKSAGDQLRAAWDNYHRICLSFQNSSNHANTHHMYGHHPELAHQIEVERAFISSFETKIREVQFAFNHAHNYMSGLVPVNSLPPEILTRIFHLVLARPCNPHLLGNNDNDFPTYPDFLTHVCARWRKVALSTCSLWCHIYLSSSSPHYAGFITRAETHAGRAGQLPIQLHISDNLETPPYGAGPTCNSLHGLFSQICTRMKALEFAVNDSTPVIHNGCVLSQVFLYDCPSLTKLTMNSECDHPNYFLLSRYVQFAGFGGDFRTSKLDVLHSRIEDVFAPLTILHLRGIFPIWSSVAYYGLVDLRLLSTSRWSQITESELGTILVSSPGLRILHFGLDVLHSATALMKIQLRNLQVLKIFSTQHRQPTRQGSPHRLLRLLAPGSKPLRICFRGYHGSEAEVFVEFESFLARSRVAQFYTQDGFPPMRLLLHHAPHLERVILDNFECYERAKIRPAWLDVGDLSSLPRLKSLDVINSILLEHQLRLMLECCPSGVTLYSSSVDRDNVKEDASITPEQLLEAFPTLKSVEDGFPSKDPTADWDILD